IEHRLDLLDVPNHMNGAVAMLAQIATLQRAETPEQVDRLDRRLRAFPTYFATCVDLLREGVAAGVTAPRVVVERTLAQVDRLLELPPTESPVTVGLEGDARDTIAEAVADAVNPSIASFRDELTGSYLAAATETIGISALPGGEAMYAAEILGWTSLAQDPRDVHERGVARLAEINDERRSLAVELGYTDAATAIAANTASGLNTASKPEQLIALAEDQ